MLDSIRKIGTHAATGVAIGLVSILVALVLFVASQRQPNPKYAVGTPELLAAVTDDTDALKILWRDRTIPNAYSLEVLIWNDGRRHLDKNSISRTDPIRVIVNPQIDVLFAKFVRTSRDNLEIKATVQTEVVGEGDAILVEIKGDEALEPKDGGLLRLLYSGNEIPMYSGNEIPIVKVGGRIKGVPKGFQHSDWPGDKSLRHIEIRSFVFLTLALLMLGAAFESEIVIRKEDKIFRPAHRNPRFLLGILLLGAGLWLLSLVQLATSFLGGLPWLPIS